MQTVTRKRRKINSEYAFEALARARNDRSWINYPTIIQGFVDKGIPAAEINPRENVLTFHAWRAVGRTVKRGEHGVKVITWVPVVNLAKAAIAKAEGAA